MKKYLNNGSMITCIQSDTLPPSLPPYLAAFADEHPVVRPQAREYKARGGIYELNFLHIGLIDEDGGKLLLGGDDHTVRSYMGRGREGRKNVDLTGACAGRKRDTASIQTQS